MKGQSYIRTFYLMNIWKRLESGLRILIFRVSNCLKFKIFLEPRRVPTRLPADLIAYVTVSTGNDKNALLSAFFVPFWNFAPHIKIRIATPEKRNKKKRLLHKFQE